jgi:uncharacterized membrane protein YgcG
MDSLQGYEATLVKSLFFGGTTTSTSKIKKHYKSSGFDPVAKIAAPLRKVMEQSAGSNGAPPIDRKWTVVCALSGVALLVWGGLTDTLNILAAFSGGFAVLVLYLAGLAGAIDYRRRLSDLRVRSLQFVPAIALVLAVPGYLLLRGEYLRLDGVMLTGLVLVSLAAVRSLLNLAKSRDGGERLQTRRRLVTARGYFERQLQNATPALDDAWFPYVLAFELGPDADRWFKSFGGQADRLSSTRLGSSPASTTAGSSWGSSSSSGSNWTGFGGGASGGAGASAAWAVAATDMAAGVSSPSSGGSSGSSSGGSSSSGSSGGGGGGGW